MKNYQIIKDGTVVDHGIPRSYTKDGVTHVIPLASVHIKWGWVQQDAAPTEEQIAAVVAACYPPPPVQLSKLSIRRKLRAMEKENEFDDFLDAQPQAKADWNDSSFVLSNDPMFTTYSPYVKSALALSDEQFASIITP